MTDTSQAITDLKNLKIHKYIRHRRIWKPFMEKYNIQKLCELGVFEGKHFDLLIEHNPQLAVAVDAWRNDGVLSRNDSGYSQETLDKMYENFAVKMLDKPFVKIFRDYTFNVVKLFPDEYFDLIYVDADHSYDGCLKDLQDWYPKVRKGGFFVGDDFRNLLAPNTLSKIKVVKAVRKFTQLNKLTVHELPDYGWVIIKI
jgi:hypothetical protein